MSESLPIEEQHRLIEQWSGLAVWVCRRFRAWVRVLGDDECKSIAYCALVRSASECDPARRDSFRAFAVNRIVWDLKEAVSRELRYGDRHQCYVHADEYADDGGGGRFVTSDAGMDIPVVLEMLPASWRQVIRSYYLEGMRDKQIGASLEVTSSAVGSIRRKALLFLRGCLEGEHPRLRPSDLVHIARGKVHRVVESEPAEPAPRLCIFCGNEFQPPHKNCKTCSEECRHNHLRQYHREYKQTRRTYTPAQRERIRQRDREYRRVRRLKSRESA